MNESESDMRTWHCFQTTPPQERLRLQAEECSREAERERAIEIERQQHQEDSFLQCDTEKMGSNPNPSC